MTTETFKGTVESAYGKQLPAAVAFSGSYEAYQTYDEVKAANDVLSNEEMLAVVNAKRKASARAKATVEALQAAGIEKPDANSPETIKANMVKMLMKLHGVDEATATSILNMASEAAGASK
jgi:hypothetical protein